MHKKKMADGSYLLVSQHISKRENQVAAQNSNSATIQSSMRRTYESNLFVKNIPSEIKEEEIMTLFSELGEVISIKLRQGKYFNPQAAYRQYFVLYKDIDCAKRAIQRFDQSTPFGARALSVQFWMPTQELHQEREQRSFQEVQQYFMKGLFAQSVFPGNNMQDGGQFRGGPQGGYRQGGNFNNNGPRFQHRDNRQGGKFNNRGRQNNRQGGRDGYQQQQTAPVNGVPANNAQQFANDPNQMAMQQQMTQAQSVDVMRLQAMEHAERRQEIGNSIYAHIQQQ